MHGNNVLPRSSSIMIVTPARGQDDVCRDLLRSDNSVIVIQWRAATHQMRRFSVTVREETAVDR